MTYKNSQKHVLSKVVIGICAALSTQAIAINNNSTYNEPNEPLSPAQRIHTNQSLKFSDWMKNEKAKSALPTRFIVKYRNNNSLASVSATNASSANNVNSIKAMTASLSRSAGVSLSHVKTMANGQQVLSMGKINNRSEVATVLRKLRADSNVLFAEEDVQRHLMSQTQPWGIGNVQADQLSDASASNMTVCIIDSGYEQANPDLNANNATGTNDSGTGNWYQNGGSHGSHVAGTIAAVNNSEGVIGVLPNTNVNLHIVKVFNAAGWGYSSDLVTAVNTCANNGAKVVNMSLGGAASSTTEKNGLKAVADSGVLLVAASGNDGDATLSYPASYDSVMAVAAVDETGKHAEFSQYTAQVEVAAPGEAILSTVAGDGRLGSITVGGTTYSNDRVVPQTHYVPSGTSYVVSNVDASVTGVLGSCAISGSSYSCTDVAGNICLAERNDNQAGSNYPEINPAKACMDAGATGVIVYSNSARPGLQNPFLVDATAAVDVPSVSVNRTLGQTLLTKVGQQVTLTTTGNQDYAYYNGTSMATPHVTAVAALAWANNITCTAAQVRQALKATAIDLETAGRDDKTGYGLVQAKAASDYLANNCDGTTGGGGTTPPASNVLANGVAQTAIAGAKDQEITFTMEVPAGATGLSFDMSGGTGDADLYVKFGSEPTLSSYDCRPWKSGNSESCPISTAQAGTYYVKVIGYSAFTGVNLTGSFTEPSTGGGTGAQGATSTTADIAASKGQWKYYTLDVPAGMATLDFNLAGGTGDADLYIRYNNQPTSSTYDCRSWKSGNTESCSFTTPAAGTWQIGIKAYRTFSGATLTTSYQP
jgi:serine protease